MISNRDLNSRTIKALIWSFTELVSKQGIQLIIQIILARLLLPEHFGMIGMITIFIALSTTFVQSGLDQALIRESNPGKEDYSTVFYFNFIISIIIYIVLFMTSPMIADFYGEPQLVIIIRVMMLVVIINSFAVIQRVILIRKVDFKTQTKISLISGVSSGIIAICVALLGMGVWSLVIQQLTSRLIEALLLILSNQWFPSLKFNIRLFKKYFNFGYKLLLSGLLDTVYKNIYFVIIGKVYPATQLGYYTNAQKLSDTSSQSVSQAIQKVTYPVLSSIQQDPLKLASKYKRIIKMTSFLFFPVMMVIVAIAPNLIPFVLGEKWIPSIIYFQLLCIAGIFYPIHALNLNVLKVKNRSDLFLTLEIMKKVIFTLLITIAIIFGNSIEALISASIIQAFIALFINTYYSGREIGYTLRLQIRDMLPAFIISVTVCFIVYFAGIFLTTWLFVTLIIQIILGITIYILLSALFNKNEFNYIVKLFNKRLIKKK